MNFFHVILHGLWENRLSMQTLVYFFPEYLFFHMQIELLVFILKYIL